MKKFTKFFVLQILILTTLLPATSVFANTFRDVPSDAWYLSDVEQLVKDGILDQTDKFRPTDFLNRAELVKMVITAKDYLGIYNAPAKPTYLDCQDVTAWYYEYIESATQLAIVHGYAHPDGSSTNYFGPNNHVTRAEAAKILVNAFGMPPRLSPSSPFPDVQPGDWFYKFVTIAYNQSVISGYPEGVYKPNDPITRAEMAKMLYNAKYNHMTLN